jgi:hypothetical protein
VVTASGARSFVVSVWVRLSPCRRPHASGPAPKSGQLASRRDLCRAVPGPARAFLWIASRPSCGECRNRAGLAALCHRSICSSSQIAKRRIRTSASVMRRHRKRPSHQWRPEGCPASGAGAPAQRPAIASSRAGSAGEPTPAARDPASRARAAADVDRYFFIVVDLHHLLLAGLPAHFDSSHPSHAVRSPPAVNRFCCTPGNPRELSKGIICDDIFSEFESVYGIARHLAKGRSLRRSDRLRNCFGATAFP